MKTNIEPGKEVVDVTIPEKLEEVDDVISISDDTGVLYCNECGESLRTNDDASTLCLIAADDCPMILKRGR